MPSPFVDKFGAAGEKLWDEAKAAVSDSRNKPESKFTDQEWALVMDIFKKKVKKAGLKAKETFSDRIQSLFTIEAKKKKKKKKRNY